MVLINDTMNLAFTVKHTSQK